MIKKNYENVMSRRNYKSIMINSKKNHFLLEPKIYKEDFIVSTFINVKKANSTLLTLFQFKKRLLKAENVKKRLLKAKCGHQTINPKIVNELTFFINDLAEAKCN